MTKLNRHLYKTVTFEIGFIEILLQSFLFFNQSIRKAGVTDSRARIIRPMMLLPAFHATPQRQPYKSTLAPSQGACCTNFPGTSLVQGQERYSKHAWKSSNSAAGLSDVPNHLGQQVCTACEDRLCAAQSPSQRPRAHRMHWPPRRAPILWWHIERIESKS